MTTRTALAASIVAAACAAVTARAEIVHFVNPAPGQQGHYGWAFEWTPGAPVWLDVMQGPQQQTNLPNGSSVAQLYESWGSAELNVHLGGAQVLTIPSAVEATFFLIEGDSVSPSDQGVFPRHWSFESTHIIAPVGAMMWSHLPFGSAGYIGVRTAEGNLGWIHVIWEASTHDMSLRALAWAYETVPGVPIAAGQIPAPGAAVVMGAGVFAVALRRRRS